MKFKKIGMIFFIVAIFLLHIQSTAFASLKGYTVFIDPGHGTPGWTGSDGTKYPDCGNLGYGYIILNPSRNDDIFQNKLWSLSTEKGGLNQSPPFLPNGQPNTDFYMRHYYISSNKIIEDNWEKTEVSVTLDLATILKMKLESFGAKVVPVYTREEFDEQKYIEYYDRSKKANKVFLPTHPDRVSLEFPVPAWW